MEATSAPDTPARPGKIRAAPKWETAARDRLKAGLRKYIKPLTDFKERDANEGDTRLLITDFLCDVLGFDKYADLTTEYQVRGEFADYGIRIDKDLVAFLEVKRVTTTLSAKHLRQVEMYAVNEGVEWVILTNGVVWQAYHLDVTAGLPVLIDLVLDVDLLGPATAAQKANQLFYLTRESLQRLQINEAWKRTKATAPKSLAALVLAPAVLDAIRKELRKKTGHRLGANELATMLRENVLRPDCLP